MLTGPGTQDPLFKIEPTLEMMMPNEAHPWRPPAKRSPFPGQTLSGRMPRKVASRRSDCTLCPVQVKAGQRVAMHFASDSWVHLGCMMRLLAQEQRESMQAASA